MIPDHARRAFWAAPLRPCQRGEFPATRKRWRIIVVLGIRAERHTRSGRSRRRLGRPPGRPLALKGAHSLPAPVGRALAGRPVSLAGIFGGVSRSGIRFLPASLSARSSTQAEATAATVALARARSPPSQSDTCWCPLGSVAGGPDSTPCGPSRSAPVPAVNSRKRA
jgi:hypothetical protein